MLPHLKASLNNVHFTNPSAEDAAQRRRSDKFMRLLGACQGERSLVVFVSVQNGAVGSEDQTCISADGCMTEGNMLRRSAKMTYISTPGEVPERSRRGFEAQPVSAPDGGVSIRIRGVRVANMGETRSRWRKLEWLVLTLTQQS